MILFYHNWFVVVNKFNCYSLNNTTDRKHFTLDASFLFNLINHGFATDYIEIFPIAQEFLCFLSREKVLVMVLEEQFSRFSSTLDHKNFFSLVSESTMKVWVPPPPPRSLKTR